MPNQIKIPVLMPRFAALDLPQIDTERDPYAIIGAAAAAFDKAFAQRDALRAKRDNEEEGLRVKAAEADTQRFVSSEVAQRREQGLVGPGFASQFDREYTERAETEMAKAKTSRERERLREAFERNRSYALHLSMQAEAGVRQEERSGNSGAALDRLSRAAYHDPMNVGRYRDEADELLKTLPAEDQEALAEERARINEAYLRGLIAKNPKLALETLQSREKAAEEDLGISEDLRRELQDEAQRAFDAEQGALDNEREDKAFDAVVATTEHGLQVYDAPREGWRSYEPIYDVYDFDPDVARRLEGEADKTARRVSAFVETAAKVGRRIAQGRPIEWDEPKVKTLDSLWRGVVGDDEWAPGVRHRMVGLAKYAGRVPDAMRRQIRAGVYSTDPGKRASAGRLLNEMEQRIAPTLVEWAPPDVRAFGHVFGALTDAGFGDQSALKHIDDGKAAKPEHREARRVHFDRRLDGDTLVRALDDALGGELRDLLFRPEKGRGSVAPLPHDGKPGNALEL
jgi:hypothetical protein